MKETIVAQATAPGRGGIGILRVSGPKALEVAQAVLGKCPKPRMADYLPFKDADGTKVFASAAEKDAANSVNRELEGYTNRQIVVRTSTYADFAAMPLPQGTVDITGIFTRFRNTWQILLRTESDVKK